MQHGIYVTKTFMRWNTRVIVSVQICVLYVKRSSEESQWLLHECNKARRIGPWQVTEGGHKRLEKRLNATRYLRYQNVYAIEHDSYCVSMNLCVLRETVVWRVSVAAT